MSYRKNEDKMRNWRSKQASQKMISRLKSKKLSKNKGKNTMKKYKP